MTPDNYCVCGRHVSECDGSRRGCRRGGRILQGLCRIASGNVRHEVCESCRQEMELLEQIERLTRGGAPRLATGSPGGCDD